MAPTLRVNVEKAFLFFSSENLNKSHLKNSFIHRPENSCKKKLLYGMVDPKYETTCVYVTSLCANHAKVTPSLFLWGG